MANTVGEACLALREIYRPIGRRMHVYPPFRLKLINNSMQMVSSTLSSDINRI